MGFISDPALCKKVLKFFKNGDSPAKICSQIGLSEGSYNRLLRRHPKLFDKYKKQRLMNQKKKMKRLSSNLCGNKTEMKKTQTKITDEDRIKILERRLANEQKKNAELETLLEVAKDHLGKF